MTTFDELRVAHASARNDAKIALRVIPTKDGLARAREIVREIRDALTRAHATQVRSDLDPLRR